MELAFRGVEYTISKTDWFAELPNGSQIWFGGLDDKERTEKILGMEFVTIYLNEASQILQGSRDIAVTRPAQQVDPGDSRARSRSRLSRACTTTATRRRKVHWAYRLFVEKRDPETKQPLNRARRLRRRSRSTRTTTPRTCLRATWTRWKNLSATLTEALLEG